MCKKSFIILQKISMILAAGREALTLMERQQNESAKDSIPMADEADQEDMNPKFEINLRDVEGAWSVVQLSMHAYKCFKVNSKLCH